MTDKHLYIKKQKAQLDEWQAKIDLLKARAKQASADTKMDLENSLKKIEAAQDALRSKIGEMQAGADSTWENVKRDVESAADDLKQAIGRAVGS